ncbi:MAG: cation:dicarboxylate symporter family transporter [Arsenophonus sp. NEOnobi-MAG3]
MIIFPLIISTLIVGILKIGDAKIFRRFFLKELLLFMLASFISITIGLVIVNILYQE